MLVGEYLVLTLVWGNDCTTVVSVAWVCPSSPTTFICKSLQHWKLYKVDFIQLCMWLCSHCWGPLLAFWFSWPWRSWSLWLNSHNAVSQLIQLEMDRCNRGQGWSDARANRCSDPTPKQSCQLIHSRLSKLLNNQTKWVLEGFAQSGPGYNSCMVPGHISRMIRGLLYIQIGSWPSLWGPCFSDHPLCLNLSMSTGTPFSMGNPQLIWGWSQSPMACQVHTLTQIHEALA